MKDDILKFRKTSDILIAEKGYNKNKISIESKLTWPTLKKVLEDPVEEIKVKASILALIQDFNKRHLVDVSYAGLESMPSEKEPAVTTPSVSGADTSPFRGRKSAGTQGRKIASSGASRNDTAKEPAKELEPKNTDDFIKFMRRLTSECPSNLKIKITINGK